ncbi:MAG: LacI family DNA-binding transcriptional regulator [Anaerolineae bacterium]|nr:LacI family DNA-binding transcriptional regulator [Anaerolineae bacterium]
MGKRLSRSKANRDGVTLKDIAEAVGKSVAAVSRALNNYDDISEETREYIKRVAREMGYAPTYTFGFIIPTQSSRNSDPFFTELLAGITTEGAKQGFDLLVSTSAPGSEENWAFLRLINSRRVDGMIVAQPRWRDERIALLLDKKFPFVVIGNTNLQGDFFTIAENTVMGAQLITDHVIQQSHDRIALINTPTDLFFSSDFLAGFYQAMESAGLPIHEEFIVNSGVSQKDGYNAAQTLLSKPEAPTAIIAADDIVALGVMAAIQDQGLEVGSDVIVTGYGDIILAEYAQPPLTTVHYPTFNLGQKACNMLASHLRGETPESEKIIFEPSVIIRQSSDLALWL